MTARPSGPGRWTVRPAQRIRGQLVLPGDKSISHRALLFSALSRGEQLLNGLSRGEDVLATLAALRAWGADIEERPDGLLRVGELPGGRLSEAASIIIPVSTVHPSETWGVKWLQRRGPAIHVPV